MKNISVEIKWAIIFTLAALIWVFMERVLGWHNDIMVHMKMTNLFAVVAIAVYVFALKDKKKNAFGGQMSWKQGLISGAILSIIVALLSPLAQYITHEFISPNYFENAITQTVELGMNTQEKAEKYFSLKNYIFQSSVFGLVMGVITSAIVALFIKNK